MTYEPPQSEEIVESPGIDDITEDDQFLRMIQELTDETTEEIVETTDEEEVEEPVVIDQNWSWDDGLSIDREKARNLALFDAWLEANPELASRLAGVAQGEYDVVPLEGRGVPTTQPTSTIPTTPANIASQQVPEDIDLTDPVQARLWNELQQTRQYVESNTQAIARQQQLLDQNTQQTTAALIERITEEYRVKNELSPDEVRVIRKQAALMIPQFTNPVDLETGLPRKIDPVYAVEQALDAAKWSIPEFRDRALNALATSKLEDLRKKSKLTSLGGSSGSVPRKATTPTTENERRDAMIQMVATEMSGGSSG